MRYLAPMKPESIPAVALPLERCVYCWYKLHPTLTYPASWSSTCCPTHSLWVLARYAHGRAARSSGKASNIVALTGTPLMKEGHG
jgi:hypothetical protein